MIKFISNIVDYLSDLRAQYVPPELPSPFSDPSGFIEAFQKYDRDCRVLRHETFYRAARNFREAITNQCVEDANEGYFFADKYGVVTASSPNPVLKTYGQRNCIVLAIRDKQTKRTLLAHLTTTHAPWPPMQFSACFYNNLTYEDRRKIAGKLFVTSEDEKLLHAEGFCNHAAYSKEEYIKLFKEEYFKFSDNEDLDATVIFTSMTPPHEVENVTVLARKYFTSNVENISHEVSENSCEGISTEIDSRTGNIKTYVKYLGCL